jgi:hypothetical protein
MTTTRLFGQDQEVTKSIARLEMVAAQTNTRLDQIQQDNKDVLDALRRMDARVAQVQGDVSNLGVQVTRLDSRLSTLERGSVQPFRSSARLTDPLAARVAGRQAGFYDEYGQPYVPMQPIVSGTYQPTQPVYQPVQQFQSSRVQFVQATPVFQAPQVQFASFQASSQYSASASGCSGGSCGTGRSGLLGRLFGRRR